MKITAIVCVLFLAVCCAPALAQAPPASVSVTVKYGTAQKVWNFFFGAPYTITDLECTQPPDATAPAPGSTMLLPGDSSTCTVTINQGAPAAGVNIQVLVPSPLTGGPAGGILTIVQGATTGTFTVAYPAAANGTTVFLGEAVEIDTPASTESYLALFIPCCARADLCGDPLSQVSQEPCQGAVN